MKLGKYLLFWFITGAILSGIFFFFQPPDIVHSTALSPLAQKSREEPVVKSQAVSTGLEAAVANALIGTYGKYAVVIKNLETGESYMRLEEDTFESASLYKLWLMATTFDQIAQGKLKENQLLTADVEDLNKRFQIASESAELTTGSISLTVRDSIEKAITISDNYAALLLTNKVKVSPMQKFLTANGFIHSKVGQPPKTTAYDISLFYEKLYQGQLINKLMSEEMLTILKRQALNDRIPKYLPDGIPIAHKTGELDGVKHDAGIVYSPKASYILVVLSESDDPLKAAERIALISKNVYEYFQQ